MEETYLTKSIVLNRRPFNEDDSRVIIYTENRGKMELVARGTKKIKSKLAGHLEPFNLSNIMVVRGRLYDYIGSAVSEKCYGSIKSDLEKIKFAGQAINVFNKLVKTGESDKNVFNLLNDFLDIVDKKKLSSLSYQLLYNFFIFKLLDELGHKPELYNCLVCKKKIVPNNNTFDLAKGGLVCGSCSSTATSPPAPLLVRPLPSNSPLLVRRGEKGLTISDDCIKVLRLVIKDDFIRLIKLKIDSQLVEEADNIICSFLNYHFELKI